MKRLKGICSLFLIAVMLMNLVIIPPKKVSATSTIIGDRDWRWPVPSSKNISSCFPNYCGHGSIHHAIDISANHGADIYASYDGTVLYTDNSCTDDRGKGNGICGCGKGGGCLGKSVYILHSYKGHQFVSRYGHMSAINVSKGQHVDKNTVIGRVGSTGASTGNHLDFTIWEGTSLSRPTSESGWVDPFLNQFLEKVNGLTHYGCNDSYVDDVNRLYGENYDPEGCLDIVSGGDGTVYVRGWVFDRDNLSSPVEIHVYVGGVAGSGAYGVPGIIANTYRPDVDSAFSGVGQYHGFDATIDVPVTGDTTVYVYAINIGGGTNPEIGHLSTHINPKPADTTPPTISNVKISNVSSSGYTVTCKVTDEGSGIDRVQFPTWFENNNPYENDGSWMKSSFCAGKISGNTVTYRVNTKNYSSKTGLYNTHIYAWDKSGNVTAHYMLQINIGNKTPYTPVATKIYNGHTYQVFDKKVKWAQANAYCQSLGGHLVTVTSSGENNIVKQLVNAVGGSCFIGGTDEETEGTWKWCTGEKINYTNWAPNEPNNFDNQDYMQMYSDGTWDDLGNQNESNYFICEYDSTYKVSLSSTELAYTGKARKPAVTVKDVNGKVISSSNYKLTYSNNTKIGQATVKVTFTGSKYSGSVSKTFYIVKANNKITVNDEFTKTAKSSSQSFKLGAKATGGKLTYASDNDKIKVDSTGKVTIAKNYSGSAVITIKAGNSNYKTVTKKVTITVKPAATTLKSVKNTTAKNASKGKFTVKWNKLSYVTGYQIQYSTSSSFKSGNKTVNVKGASSVSKAITGLAKNKTYYVRIRTYKTIEGKKVYSSWSAKKSVKVK